LQAKTQVLGLGESDFYRTRLTHSMEVAQIGAGLRKILLDKLNDNNKDLLGILPDPALMQTICLAHDIGHPPFGHGGEVALNKCMLDYGGFEGNGQTLRILTRLDKYTMENGLNPTRRLTLGVLKYPIKYSDLIVPSALPAVDNTKPSWLFKAEDYKPPKCYHDEEDDVVKNFILKDFSTNDLELIKKCVEEPGKHRKPLYKSFDTSIMDLADKISYSLHDLEDAISLGMITKEMWESHFSNGDEANLAQFLESVPSSAKNFNAKLFGQSWERKQCIGALVNFMITRVEVETQNQNFENQMFKFKAALTPAAEALRSKIFKLVEARVVKNENVQQLEFKGQKLVVELFEVFSTDPSRFLPESTKKKYEIAATDSTAGGMRVICDFISGMTDDYATRMYEKLFLPRKGSVFDKL
jgi:dGTPase